MYKFKTTLTKKEKFQLCISKIKYIENFKYIIFDDLFENVLYIQIKDKKNWVSVFYKDKLQVINIFRFLFWNLNNTLYCKLYIGNPIIKYLLSMFKFKIIERKNDMIIVKRYQYL